MEIDTINIKQAQKKIYVMIILILTIILATYLTSCETKTNWDMKSSQEQFLIVDGIITNEFRNQSINLSLSVIGLNDSIERVSDANVFVTDGETSYYFQEDTIKGLYISEAKFAAVINKTYTLNIEKNNKEYYAQANIRPVAISDPLPYKQIADTNLYYIAADVAEFNPNESAMYEVILDWSDVSGYDSLPFNETSAHMFFYNLKTIDVNQIFSPTHEIVIFPQGSSMIQKKYSLSTQHEMFIRSLLFETQWHGGNFDIEEGNVCTNLSDGALGFFAACSVITYSSVVD